MNLFKAFYKNAVGNPYRLQIVFYLQNVLY